MRVNASQHIYSQVPKDLSPTNRRGFQTLCYTQSDLSPEEVSILEDRAQYYSSEIEPIKYQFHILPTRKAVITRIVPLPEPDEFGRKGRYLSHSLILSSGEFKALEYCPLGLFASKWFYGRIEDVRNNCDDKTGNIPYQEVDVADTWEDGALMAARGWKSDQLEKLARLGWQAQLLQEKQQPVGIDDKLEGVLNTLSVVFLLTSPAKRPFLTFDTYAYGCDWSRDWPFWVWGNSDQITEENSYYIFSESLHVQSNLTPERDSPYEHWIVTRALPENLEHFIDKRDDALKFEQTIQGDSHTITPSQDYEDQYVQDVVQVNSRVIARKLINQLPWDLSQQTITMINEEIQSYPNEYYKWIGSGLTLEKLSQFFNQLVLENIQVALPRKDRKVLNSLAQETSNSGLLGVLKLNAGDIAGWRNSIDNLTFEEYQQQLRILYPSGIVSTSDAFNPDYLEVWANESGPFIKPGEIKKVLSRLNKHKESFKADHLYRLLPYLGSDDRNQLAKWVRGYPGPAPKLRSFLLSNEEPSGSIFGKVKSILPGGSSKSKRDNKR